MKTCPLCNSVKSRPERSRVSRLRAEDFGDFIFLDHGSAKIGDKTFGFLIVFDGATSHLIAHPCTNTSTSEAIAKIHEWMDTFQMNPKAICADMATILTTCGILPNAQCEEISNKTTCTMAELSRNGCATVQEISFGTGGYSLQKPGPDHSGTNHSIHRCPQVAKRPWNWPWDENQEIS